MSALPFGMNKKLSHRSRRLSGLARHRHHHPKPPQTLFFKGSRVVYNLQRQQHSRVHLTGLQNPYRAMHEVLFLVEYPVSFHLLPYIGSPVWYSLV